MGGNGQTEMFRRRRRRFMEEIGAAVAILPSAPVAMRSNDVEFIYRQDNDFYYLTGFKEPESVALFAPASREGEYLLFVRPRDRERETWTGPRAGVEGAMADYGADRAYPIDELEQILPHYLSQVDRVWYGLGPNERMNQRILALVKTAQAMRPRLGTGPSALFDPRPLLHEARLRKAPEELDAMRRAAAIATEAHRRAMRAARPGMREWEIEALVDYTFRSLGAAGPSYPSIVASGPSAATLHYVNNDREIGPGELVLLDAGCEYDFYASDVTRTFPAGAPFTPFQRDLYQVVLEAQLAAIETVRPGATVEDVHNAALNVLVPGMCGLGLLTASPEEALASGSYRRFYMHRTSHWLGMDVHDVGLYVVGGKSRRLEPGMVLTVEPGIYIAAGDETVPGERRGVGVRIEDDVLVAAEGHEVLSAAVPKLVAEIEELATAPRQALAPHPAP